MTEAGRIVDLRFNCLEGFPDKEARMVELGERWTHRLRKKSGGPALFPVQGAVLEEAFVQHNAPGGTLGAGGIMAACGVGTGKTLLLGLLCKVLSAENGLAIVPSYMLKDNLLELQHWQQYYDFKLPILLSSSKISNPKFKRSDGRSKLHEYRPDVIVVDECHELSNLGSSRTKRLTTYIADYEETILCSMSGTLISKSVMDNYHLAKLTLREGSYLPLDEDVAQMWASVLDVRGRSDRVSRRYLQPIVNFSQGLGACSKGSFKEQAQKAYGYRFKSCAGVIASNKISCNSSLQIVVECPEVPPAIAEALMVLQDEWMLPNGDELVDTLEIYRHEDTIKNGYYTYVDWEDGPDEDYISARKAWGSFLTYQIEHGGPKYDSRKITTDAVIAGDFGPRPIELLETWKEQRAKYGPQGPPSKVVWLKGGDYLIKFAKEWIKRPDNKSGAIIWWTHLPVAAMLYRAGFEIYGAGSETPVRRVKGRGGVTFPACSLRVHGTGKNLQSFSRQLLLEPPSSGRIMEQFLGRTHRPGQVEDLCHTTTIGSTSSHRKALKQAIVEARAIQNETTAPQRLCMVNMQTIDGSHFFSKKDLPEEGAEIKTGWRELMLRKKQPLSEQ